MFANVHACCTVRYCHVMGLYFKCVSSILRDTERGFTWKNWFKLPFGLFISKDRDLFDTSVQYLLNAFNYAFISVFLFSFVYCIHFDNFKLSPTFMFAIVFF